MASPATTNPATYPYETHLDVRFAPLDVVDVPALVAQVRHPWYNQTLCKVNDSVIRLGVFQPGEYHWHKHDQDDEFFFITGASPTVRRALLTHGVSPPRARYRETIERAVADIRKSLAASMPAADDAAT